MINPLVSIIIPVYNVELYLNMCIESVVNQTYKNIEIILVDDGSTDSSGMMCDAWASRDERISVIHKYNGGLSDARNAGIRVARGDYLEFIDSDDIVSEQITEHLIGIVEAVDSDISICEIVHCRPGEKLEYRAETLIKVFTIEDALCEMMYQKSFLFSACGKVYKKSLFNEVQFPVGMLFEDVAVMYKLFCAASKIAYSDAKLYGYLHRENSITTKKFGKRDCDILEICQEQLDFAREYSPKVYDAALAYQVTGAFRVYLNAPNDDEFINDTNVSENIIKKNGIKLIKNPQVRMKTKVAILMFYISKKLLRKVYGYVDRWQ